MLQDTEVTGNTATADGGGVSSDGNFTITGGTFSENTAGLLGGAIDSSGKGTIAGTDFSDEHRPGRRRRLRREGRHRFPSRLRPSRIPTASTSIVATRASTRTRPRKAVPSNRRAPSRLSTASFSNNTATTGTGFGGAIYNNQGKGSVTGSTFSGTAATWRIVGGAIDSTKGPFTVTDSTFTGNTAGTSTLAGNGGAIAATGTFTINGGNFSENSAVRWRGHQRHWCGRHLRRHNLRQHRRWPKAAESKSWAR